MRERVSSNFVTKHAPPSHSGARRYLRRRAPSPSEFSHSRQEARTASSVRFTTAWGRYWRGEEGGSDMGGEGGVGEVGGMCGVGTGW